VTAMLSDDDLTLLLGRAAGSYDPPGQGPDRVLEELVDVPAPRPWHRRRGVQLVAAAAVVAVGAVLVHGIGTSGTPRTELTAGAPAGQPSDGSVRTDLRGAGSTGSTGSTGGTAAGGTGGTGGLEGGAARIVKTGSLDLVVGDGRVSATVDRVIAVATGAAGYVSNQKSVEFGDRPTSTLTMRVPVASYESVVAAVRGVAKDVGGKVAGAQSTGKDVTAAYADTAAQIQSLRAARSRFLRILAGARTIGETLTVQQRVDDVQGRLDRLEGQRRVLANQSALATLTVGVSEKADMVTPASAPSGLSKAWDDAKDGFTGGIEGLVAGSGRALLVLMVAAAALVAARLGWRLARRRLL
jgi:hypothetical protein